MWLLALLFVSCAKAEIPATPVMTLYRFNGPLALPYIAVEDFVSSGRTTPAGTLVQGTTLIPCLVIRAGRPLTDDSGTPLVGFEIVVEPRAATAAATARVTAAIAERKALRVPHHHCGAGVRHVLDVRNLYAMEKVPFFDPPRSSTPAASGAAEGPATIVHAFHDSAQCAQANASLVGRRRSLARAWDEFTRANPGQWPEPALNAARHLDYTLRTALFEGHLARGCSAYGACERNIVALTIRNRAIERCFKREGCRTPGDFSGVASSVSQYNIWDEYLTQISGLTACFLRRDLGNHADYARLQAMHAQNLDDTQRILFGTDVDLAELFTGASLADIKKTAHYYHAPAMSKCLPHHPRVEYMSGAVAQSGNAYALLANTRIEVGDKLADGYRFRAVYLRETEQGDHVEIEDDYPGFVVDPRKVTLKPASGCKPYGVPAGCKHGDVARYRRTPPWLTAGKPIGLTCRINERGASCGGTAQLESVEVGASCDTQMRPVSGVH